MWLFADLNEPRSQHCLMLVGRSLNNLAPKLANENLKLFFDSLRPSLLAMKFIAFTQPSFTSQFFRHEALLNDRDTAVYKFEKI